MDINRAAADVERFVSGYVDDHGRGAREVRVRPSGDEPSHIKIWVDLGPGVDDAACAAWAKACAAAAADLAEGFELEVRAESL